MLTKTTLMKAVQQAAAYGKETLETGRERVAAVLAKDSPWKDARDAPEGDSVYLVLWDGHGYWQTIGYRRGGTKHHPDYWYRTGEQIRVDVVWYAPLLPLPPEASDP